MLVEYIQGALEKAEYKKLDDGRAGLLRFQVLRGFGPTEKQLRSAERN